jgi:RNA polymerase sigma factor (sigma-70 family)
MQNTMHQQNWTDEHLIQAIKGHDEALSDRALQFILQSREWKLPVLRFILQNGGNEADGEDVFQEAVIGLYLNVRRNRFNGDSKLYAYFFGIARRKWLEALRKRKPTEEFMPQHETTDTESPETTFLTEEKKHYLEAVIDQFGERCQKVLTLYKLDYSMQEIAQRMGMSSADMAKKDTYRCRKRIYQFFEENPDWKNFFKAS